MLMLWVPVIVAGCGTSRKAEQGRVSLTLRQLYLRDGLLWLSFEARNRSAFDFRVDWMSFTVRGRRLGRRRALQETRVQPVFMQQPSTIPGDSSVSLIYGLPPRVLGSGKEMLVELRERSGDRRVRMIVSAKKLLRTKKNNGDGKGIGGS
jgi:hypothetical protein